MAGVVVTSCTPSAHKKYRIVSLSTFRTQQQQEVQAVVSAF